MIEISEDLSKKVEKSENPKVVYDLLEGYIGRRLRIKYLTDQSAHLQILITSGTLRSITVAEQYNFRQEDPKRRSSFDELCIAIDAQEEDIEVNFDEDQLQVEAFQEDSGKWILIYRSKHWKKMLKNGYSAW